MTSKGNATPLKSDILDRSAIARDFNLWVHDACSHQMYACDVDLVIYKLKNKCLRIWEAKHENEPLRGSQKTILPILSKMVNMAVATKLLAVGSGVFVVRGEVPYTDGAMIQNCENWSEKHLTQSELVAFVDMDDAKTGG